LPGADEALDEGGDYQLARIGDQIESDLARGDVSARWFEFTTMMTNNKPPTGSMKACVGGFAFVARTAEWALNLVSSRARDCEGRR
jgi:hypothetical protein